MTNFGEPWTYDEMKLTDSNGKIVAYINHDEAVRDHVLRLVNSWPELVEVLEAASEARNRMAVFAALGDGGDAESKQNMADESAFRLASALAAYRDKSK